MTPGAILTLGLGAYSDVNHLVTLGYGTGATPPVPNDITVIWGRRPEFEAQTRLDDELIVRFVNENAADLMREFE